jgi:hypothetical protein
MMEGFAVADKRNLEEEATSKGTELLRWQSPTPSVAEFYLNPNSKTITKQNTIPSSASNFRQTQNQRKR